MKTVLVCQNRSCRKQGAEAVLAAFLASPVTNVKVIGSGCLGKCGNGPMVLIMPEQVWHSQVHPGEVNRVVGHN
jgi:NADH:ubiquinone oxidoreductase subunit E